MTLDEIFTFYERLWRRAEVEDVWVLYRGIASNGELGFFHPREEKGVRSTIWIIRPYYTGVDQPSTRRHNGPLTTDELHGELITLAHEYGHFQSWSRSKAAGGEPRAAWERYHATANKFSAISTQLANNAPVGISDDDYNTRMREAYASGLTEDDRDRIIAEESLAWVIGRETLVELAWDDFAAFDERQRRALHIYNYRLGREELWPDEIAAG